MDFRIERSEKTRALYLMTANLGVTLTSAIVIFTLGTSHNNIDYVDVVFEAASGTVAFLLFVAAAQVMIAGARMSWLLLGLFLFQAGAMIDVLDEVVSFNFSSWSVAGDALRLAGELTLASVALLFVRLTNKIASTDRLTGLYSRAFHTRWIDQYLSDPKHTAAVIAIDLDNFKAVNDAHGHAFGDTVLKHIGALLTDFMRLRRGIASRTGGEEFELTLKHADEQGALKMAEEVRQLIESTPPSGIDRVTASIGVALSLTEDDTARLRKRADAAAYFSKQSGRNRVTLAGQNQTLNAVEPSE